MIYVLGTHQYQQYLFPFAYLFKKYWGNDKIIYVGDRQDGKLPDNIEFMQVPAYTEGIWNWNDFGNGLLSLLDIIIDKIIVLLLPDHWINSPVDIQGVKTLKKFMLKYPYVIRGNLTAGTLYDAYGEKIDKLDGYSITSVFPGNIKVELESGITFCPSLWNVELLKQIIQHDWGFWDCESAGTKKICHHRRDLMTISTSPAVLHRTHALHHGNRGKISFAGLSAEDRKTVEYLCKKS